MSRRKRRRLIELEDVVQKPFPSSDPAFGYGGASDPLNWLTASTPPQGVQNPEGTPHSGSVSGQASGGSDEPLA